MQSRSRRSAIRLLTGMAFVTISQVRGEEKHSPNLVYLVNRKNEVRSTELTPGMTLVAVILRMGGYSSKGSIFHHWRHIQRKPLPWVKDTTEWNKIKLQPDDVVIDGWLDEARAKLIEHIPEISAALKLPANAPPAEVNRAFDF